MTLHFKITGCFQVTIKPTRLGNVMQGSRSVTSFTNIAAVDSLYSSLSHHFGNFGASQISFQFSCFPDLTEFDGGGGKFM